MSTAHKGRRFEHEIRDLFRQAGFSVMRGAGSKGELLEEKTDLICTKLTRDTSYTCYLQVIGVQCKARGRSRRDGAESTRAEEPQQGAGITTA